MSVCRFFSGQRNVFDRPCLVCGKLSVKLRVRTYDQNILHEVHLRLLLSDFGFCNIVRLCGFSLPVLLSLEFSWRGLFSVGEILLKICASKELTFRPATEFVVFFLGHSKMATSCCVLHGASWHWWVFLFCGCNSRCATPSCQAFVLETWSWTWTHRVSVPIFKSLRSGLQFLHQWIRMSFTPLRVLELYPGQRVHISVLICMQASKQES